MAEKIYIGGELESRATGNKVADVANIKDKTKGDKSQADINAETEEALADRYTKEETYNKEELDSLITTPQVNYESVTATEQTTAATDVLPATGEADTIYRVGYWDGSQYDATCYSEYAWKGDSYVHLSTKPRIGEVFDISAYRATGGTLAKYADLSAALDGGNNIPQSLQKGGMSVKFVQSSDNKYVQFRYMSSSTAAADFTNTSNWQGVDDEPTDGSHNLAESGGIKNDLNKVVPSHYSCVVGGNVFRRDFENGHTYIVQNNTSQSINVKVGDNSNIDHYQNAGNIGAGETKEFTVDNNYTYQYLYIYSNEANSDAVVLYDKNYYIEEIESLHQKDDELALDAVYDVSAKNPTAGPNNDGKWESISALLSDANLSTLIPTSVRKGGMSIKFIQSSNKYMQYRLMLSEFTAAQFTNAANWQGVDDKPIAGSDNLVKSGGVFGCLEYGTNIPFELKSGKFYDLGANNTITEVDNAASKYLERIDVSSFIGDYIVIQLSNFSTSTSSRIIAIGDSNNIASRYLTEGNPTKVEGSIAQYIMPIDSPYLFISFRSECILDYIKPLSTNVGKAVEDLYGKINEVREESVQDSDIEIDIISNNIFNSDNLHRDALVGNDGDVSSAEGWQYALIEVEPGQTITFGRFSLGRNGYYAFYNGEPSLSTLVSVSSFDDPDGGVAATVTVPNGAKYLCIDIVSPTTIGGESPLFTANYGTTLKPHDEYSEAITKINGVKLVGVKSEGTSMLSLVVDLPVSDGTGIESGYAYIDSTDRTVKVKE